MSNSVYISLQKQQYSLLMEYDNMHNILSKNQIHETSPDNTNWTKAHQTTYDLTYEKYNAAEYNVAGYFYTQPHAVRQIIDKPEATSTGNDVKTKIYDYDQNGNLTHITQKTGDSDAVEKLRTNLWDEENRLRAVDITPDAEGVRPIAIYTYDAGGERILKHSNTSVSIYLNGKKVADTIQVDATLYPSGMLVAKLGSNGSEEEQTLAYTKHYFAGTQRVSSKIGTTENLGDFLQDWFTQGTGGPVDVIGSSFGVLENAEQGVVQVYDEFDIEPPVYDSNPVFIPVQSFVHGDNEIEQYFFHPDHLGSTSYITNLLGEVSQHIEYFAFGETFVEEHRSSNNSPYKFNGKELDEETGWYYYGARYYDPRVSVWLSVDPLMETTMQPYQYCYQNPLRYIDPTGMSGEDPPVKGIKTVFYNKDGTVSNEIPKQVEEMFKSEYGIKVKCENGILSKDGEFETNNIISSIAKNNWDTAFESDSESNTTLIFGYDLYSTQSNEYLNAEKQVIYGVFSPDNNAAYIDLADFNNQSMLGDWIFDGSRPANFSDRVMNLARIVEHEFLVHALLGLGHDVNPDPTILYMNAIEKQVGDFYRLDYSPNIFRFVDKNNDNSRVGFVPSEAVLNSRNKIYSNVLKN